MKTNTIYNESCMDTMDSMPNAFVDIVLTSPFYNTNKKSGKGRTLTNTKVKDQQYHYCRYDSFVDNMTNEEYFDFTVNLFNKFDRILKPNGCVLYNISYGSENTECMFLTLARVLENTNFTIADCIVWKKKSALPNSCSPNKLTRITEFVFVFCRRDELGTFKTNKEVVSCRESGQKMYNNVFNFIEAKNNDGSCPYNKATFSTELCEKLLRIYAPPGALVYDPFMGSGTTAVACQRLKLSFVGSEISKNQVEWAKNRLLEDAPKTALDIFLE